MYAILEKEKIRATPGQRQWISQLENSLDIFFDEKSTNDQVSQAFMKIGFGCRDLHISPHEFLMQKVISSTASPSQPQATILMISENVVIQKEIIKMENHKVCVNPGCKKIAKVGSKYCDNKTSSCRVAYSKSLQTN